MKTTHNFALTVVDNQEFDHEYDSDVGEDEVGEGDIVFQEIQRRLSAASLPSTVSTLGSRGVEDEDTKLSDSFTHWPSGFQPRLAYEHAKKYTDIMAVTYNARMHQFVMLDAKGVTTWSKDAVHLSVSRAMNYPKYEYRLITNMVYARKYNVYFALGRDFSLKVLNRNFDETCSVSADMRCVLFMVFNPVRDELITGGVGGTKVWKYHQAADKAWGEIKPMANYKLTLKYELPNVGGSWVRRVELDQTLQHLYCCSDTDLSAYNMDGQKLFSFDRAHTMSITGCAYSTSARLLITASLDAEVKVWSIVGGLVHTFRGHSKAVTNIILHPDNSSLVLSSSQDGTVRMWSLDTMDLIYSLVVSSEGVLYMGVTDEKLLYLGTARNITLWSVSLTASFWAVCRNPATHLCRVDGGGKSMRILTLGEDNSVRLFCRKSQKNLTTVLPPPSISPLDRMLDLTYNRLASITYILVDNKTLWLYTNKTDPACHLDTWNLLQIQESHKKTTVTKEEPTRSKSTDSNQAVLAKLKLKKPGSGLLALKGTSQRATEAGTGSEPVSKCLCVCALNSPVMLFADEGNCCLLQESFLLLGLEDGRILFMDPRKKGTKYMELRVNKDPVVKIFHDFAHKSLITRCDGANAALFQFWSLPDLDLCYEVYTTLDVTTFARLNESLLTGNSVGVVEVHQLILKQENTPIIKPKVLLEEGVGSELASRADHLGPVIAMDSCLEQGIFMSCSGDGCIKIWDENKAQLTEVQLDDSLTAAGFLNRRGDLLVGYQNHIFKVDHSIVLSELLNPDVESDSETESEIYEDPSVLFEGVRANPDPINLDSYLVPYKLEEVDEEFNKEADKKSSVAEIQEDEHSEVESFAPTDMYLSPGSTPRFSRATTPDMERKESDTRVTFLDEEACGFKFPQFGTSPGPTPSPTPPSTPRDEAQPLEMVAEEPEEMETEERPEVKLITTTKLEVEVSEVHSTQDDQDTSMDVSPTPVPIKPVKVEATAPKEFAPRPSVSIHLEDAASYVQSVQPRQESLPVFRIPEDAPRGASAPPRTIKKKEFSGTRKMPKKAVKKKPPKDAKKDKWSVAKAVAKLPGSMAKTKMSVAPKVTQMQELTQGDADNNISKLSNFGLSPYRRRNLGGVSQPGQMGSSSQQPQVVPQEHAIDMFPSASSVPLAARGEVGQDFADKGKDIAPGPSRNVFEEMERLRDDKMKLLLKEKKKRRELQRKKDGGGDHSTGASEGGKRNIQIGGTSGLLSAGNLDLSVGDHEHSSSVHRDLLSVKDSIANSRLKSGQRSRSPQAYSDYESEWTVPLGDGESVGDGLTEDGLPSIKATIRQRPRTSDGTYSRRARYAEESSRPQRPHTAHFDSTAEMSKKDLEEKFDEALLKYKGIPGTPEYINSLHKNDGTSYNNTWHEKAIERHYLLRLQKELRTQSVCEKRRQIELAEQEKHKHSPTIERCDTLATSVDAEITRDTFVQLQRAQSAFSENERTRKGQNSDFHPSRRTQGQNSDFHQSRRTQVQNSDFHQSRRTQSSMSNLDRSQSSRTIAPSVPPRPKTAAAKLQGTQCAAENARPSRSELNAEQPFRCRIRGDDSEGEVGACPTAEKVDLQMYDPRNEAARAFFLNPTKSIPSKCNRYLLIVQPKESDVPVVPNMLEKTLIQERFPQWEDKWLIGKIPHRLAPPKLHTATVGPMQAI